MPFSTKVKTRLLVKAGRRCCLCWEFCGPKIEVHHIIPESEGGTDEEGNGMPLCLDCHADVGAYNDRHPKGIKYRPEELRQHRDRLFRWIERDGPVVFDRLAGEAVLIKHDAMLREEPPPVTTIDLSHSAKVARYLRYIRQAEQFKDRGQFLDAIRAFESAFRIADSDTDLKDYAQSCNYFLQKLLLWECVLEVAVHDNTRRHLRAAFNMDIEENAIQQIYSREGIPGGLQCQNYFYLLLQEYLFLFDEEIGQRRPRHERLARIGYFMDLIENPHCSGRTREIIDRAQGVERDTVEKLKICFPTEQYSRALS